MFPLLIGSTVEEARALVDVSQVKATLLTATWSMSFGTLPPPPALTVHLRKHCFICVPLEAANPERMIQILPGTGAEAMGRN